MDNTISARNASIQVTDQVRLEGHGLIAQPVTDSRENIGDLWLPIAPTAPPAVRFVGKGGGIAGATSGGHPGLGGAAPSAGLIAQQAIDEARLDMNSEVRGKGGKSAAMTGEKVGDAVQQRPSEGPDACSWCCVCSEDAALRCKACEEDKGEDEPELFCARCFREVHRGDPDLQSHRPQTLSRLEDSGKGVKKDGARRGTLGWRRR